MSAQMAVALLALLVALFALVALLAVYARVRALEAGREVGLSGYAAVVGRPAPLSIRPRPGQRAAIAAVLDADCALCHAVWDALAAIRDVGVRLVAVVDRADAFAPHPGAELLGDPAARAELFEGYAPTVLQLDAAGTVVHRTFVDTDTDLRALFRIGSPA
ncbi:hypothetical protein FHX44_11245 [Pseudonocardia hierapolitana]|uniref:Thioredoxin domain-containing protein n=1 Tax=Pseudonocardia hierapolitana TaxID=1128676 RepID=A0A561SHT7_9PSEU|nr:hypothetical protein [Pseudonocardia hierapolitana]TWF74365.1 hypothetical protein FHX44_11245 [Pseudonocardia hierapolitana]